MVIRNGSSSSNQARKRSCQEATRDHAENSERVEFKLGEKEIASRLRGNKRPVNSERVELKPGEKDLPLDAISFLSGLIV